MQARYGHKLREIWIHCEWTEILYSGKHNNTTVHITVYTTNKTINCDKRTDFRDNLHINLKSIFLQALPLMQTEH
jgi:hypothetical protein